MNAPHNSASGAMSQIDNFVLDFGNIIPSRNAVERTSIARMALSAASCAGVIIDHYTTSGCVYLEREHGDC